MVTYDGLFQYTLVILTAISLFYNIYKKTRNKFLNKRNTALPPTDWRCFFTLNIFGRTAYRSHLFSFIIITYVSSIPITSLPAYFACPLGDDQLAYGIRREQPPTV